MPEYITVTEKIERRTYLKGHLTAKFVGTLDEVNSDLKIENFYDIEVLEAKVLIQRAHFRTWLGGDDDVGAREFEEFIEIEKFTVALPNPIHCEVIGEGGFSKHYNLHIFDPKLLNYKFSHQLYEKEQMFAVIESEISGYLRHYDTVEKQIELPAAPELVSNNTRSETSIPIVPTAFGSGIGFNLSPSSVNRGCLPQLGCSATALPTGGCGTLIGISVLLYLGFAVLMILSKVTTIFVGAAAIILPFLFSVIIPLFLVGAAIYIFVKIQSRLSLFWRIIFRLLIVFFIFLFWFA